MLALSALRLSSPKKTPRTEERRRPEDLRENSYPSRSPDLLPSSHCHREGLRSLPYTDRCARGRWRRAVAEEFKPTTTRGEICRCSEGPRRAKRHARRGVIQIEEGRRERRRAERKTVSGERARRPQEQRKSGATCTFHHHLLRPPTSPSPLSSFIDNLYILLYTPSQCAPLSLASSPRAYALFNPPSPILQSRHLARSPI